MNGPHLLHLKHPRDVPRCFPNVSLGFVFLDIVGYVGSFIKRMLCVTSMTVTDKKKSCHGQSMKY
jgi:hypothetical protein